MRRVAAYRLECRPTEPGDTYLQKALTGAHSALHQWLVSKGASNSTRDGGTYVARDGSSATFRQSSLESDAGILHQLELKEISDSGRVFRTSIALTSGPETVTVYVTMDVGTTGALIERVPFEARCPEVIRQLLALPVAWRHGNSRLLNGTENVVGHEAGAFLAEVLLDEDRAIPFVVVSREGDSEVVPGLSESLARDLAGLANLLVIDGDAAWALTGILGRQHSVFGKGVRLYWPGLDELGSPFDHPLWTASRIAALQSEPSSRLRDHIRRMVMDASAMSVSPPLEIDEVRIAKARAEHNAMEARSQELDALKTKANSLSDFEELAESFARENEDLRTKVELGRSEIETLTAELREKDSELRRLRFNLSQVASQNEAKGDLAPAEPGQDDPESAPKPGDVRFYKKVSSGGGRDYLVRVGGCGHNKWQNSHGADQARKGLERLQLREWKTLLHCGTCTGGGMWRVEW